MSSPSASPAAAPAPALSERCQHIVQQLEWPNYIVQHMTKLNQQQTTNSNGLDYIPLAFAENKIVYDLLEPKLIHRNNLSLEHTGYYNFRCTQVLKQPLAQFAEQYLFQRPVDPERLTLTAGCNAALDLIFFAICNPGDVCLLQTPYYAVFKQDLSLRANVDIYPVPMSATNQFQFNIDAYERAYHEAKAKGLNVKAVLLCSPNNPLGINHTKEELLQLFAFVDKYNLHLVSDEIYALSQRNPEKPFISIAQLLDAKAMGDRYHITYALSKDFAISGFRCGMLYSENRSVNQVADQLVPLAAASSDIQLLLHSMLTDSAWLQNYISENQRRLRSLFEQIEQKLKQLNIPFVQGSAGLFLLVDFTQFLEEQTPKGESDLWLQLMNEANVNLTPGLAFHCEQPGWFRICPVSQPTPRAIEAIERVINILQNKKQTKP